MLEISQKHKEHLEALSLVFEIKRISGLKLEFFCGEFTLTPRDTKDTLLSTFNVYFVKPLPQRN